MGDIISRPNHAQVNKFSDSPIVATIKVTTPKQTWLKDLFETTYTVGRSDRCSIQLPQYKKISRVHFTLQLMDGWYYRLVDGNAVTATPSANGSLIDGVQVVHSFNLKGKTHVITIPPHITIFYVGHLKAEDVDPEDTLF